MGATFATATAVFVLLVGIFTFRWHEDTRKAPATLRTRLAEIFLLEMKTILADPNPRWVFVFIFIVCVGMVIVSSLQMFVYDDFMKFTAWQKSIAHGSTMVGMALGALVSMGLTRRFDKKGAVLIGWCRQHRRKPLLAALFLTGLDRSLAPPSPLRRNHAADRIDSLRALPRLLLVRQRRSCCRFPPP